MAAASSEPRLCSVLLFLACLSAGCAMARGGHQHETLSFRLFAVKPTMTNVVGLNTTDHNVSRFGDINILNGVLYERGELNLPPVATAQGLAVGVSLTDLGMLTSLNVVFVGGQYNGSSLLLIGGADDPVPGTSFRSIVGGSGVFRLARGYVNSVVTQSEPFGVAQFDFYVVPDKEFYYF